MKKQIIRIIIFSLIITIFGLYMNDRGIIVGTRADVVGNLKFTYPNGVTPQTLFNETDFKPGDCEEAIVHVENLVAGNSIVGVFSDGESDSDGFSANLTIEITDGTNTLYGPLPLSTFFTDSDILNQIELLTLAGNGAVDLHFIICFPDSDDNELQGDTVVFDLKFGHIPPPIDLPPVCDDLEGIVTEVIEGTPFDDEIDGTTASEFIRGFAGNDEIDGGGGHDCIIGDEGEDDLDGGSGNDIIDGGDNNDDIDGGSGEDLMYGGNGEDKIDAGSGNDYVEGGPGNDKISGGSGNDELLGQEGNDTIRGGSGNDTLDGGPDTDTLNGNSGTDTCTTGETLSSCEL